MTKYVWCSNNEKYYRSRKNKHNDSILSFAQSCIDKNIYSYDKLEYEPNENGFIWVPLRIRSDKIRPQYFNCMFYNGNYSMGHCFLWT